MELREYWEIIRRRWWVPAALALAALLASSFVALRGAAAYRTDLRLVVSTLPTVERSRELYYDPVYYANLSAEYLADDLSVLIPSEAFANDVSRELGFRIGPSTIASVTRAKKTHRLIDVSISTATPAEGREIGEAIASILGDPARAGTYLRAMDAYRAQVSVVSRPVTHPAVTPLGLASEIGLRTLVGLIVGLGLALLLDYLDQSIRGRGDVERELGLPLLGVIPRAKRRESARVPRASW